MQLGIRFYIKKALKMNGGLKPKRLTTVGFQQKIGVRLLFSKSTVESYRELCVFSLKRLGMTNTGCSGLLQWTSSRTGEVKSTICIRMGDGQIYLSYRSRSYGEEWEAVTETIRLSKTYPNYGGERMWLICPRCHSRRAKLYGGKYFRCRGCRDLCYESQLETGSCSIMSAMYRIRRRLGDQWGLNMPFPEKPKGMRWKTYNALYDRYEALDGHLSAAFIRRFGMLDGLL